jgi:hypothetical protein
MSNRRTKIIDGTIQINSHLIEHRTFITKALESGAVGIEYYRPDLEEEKSDNQREKFHAMINDVNKTGVITMPGKRIVMINYDADQCKALLVMWFANEKALLGEKLPKPPSNFTDPLTGQNITIRPSTKTWGKKLTCDFVEFLYATGALAGVKWSEPALKEYQSYKEAQ